MRRLIVIVFMLATVAGVIAAQELLPKGGTVVPAVEKGELRSTPFTTVYPSADYQHNYYVASETCPPVDWCTDTSLIRPGVWVMVQENPECTWSVISDQGMPVEGRRVGNLVRLNIPARSTLEVSAECSPVKWEAKP